MVKIYLFELTSSVCDKDISLLSVTLAKKIVSVETLTPLNKVLIGKTNIGKPIIKYPRDSNFDISISHSSSYLVIGICDSGKIGVDIEILKDTNFEIFSNCLSTNEELYINSGGDSEQRLKNFYEIWTRKEAYLKVLGIGLQKPLPITEFYLDQFRPKRRIGDNGKYYYYSTMMENNFVLSVCTTRSESSYLKCTKLTCDEVQSFIESVK